MNIEYVILIAILSSLLAYYIGAYYGEKTGANIQITENIWHELVTSGEICHKCANAGVTVCENCGHHDWESIYKDVKRNR
tara:strand:- start:1624 stop:1863 length:240 start_codon:yes stop_codon:yes gene_type:complete